MASEEFMDEIIESEIEQMEKENKFEKPILYSDVETRAAANASDKPWDDRSDLEIRYEQLKAENAENINALIHQIKLRDEQVKDYERALESITRLTAYAGTPTKEITDYLTKQAGHKCSDIAREVLKKWSEL